MRTDPSAPGGEGGRGRVSVGEEKEGLVKGEGEGKKRRRVSVGRG